jgi:TonB family protein
MVSLIRTFFLIVALSEFLPVRTARAEIPPPDTYVTVEIEYDTGKVTDAQLTKSTGDPKLDAATLERFRKWRFKPKTVRRVKIPIMLAEPKK